MSEPFRYDGKRVVVSGCSSGIGEATALGAARLGADVVGVDIKPPRVHVAEFVELDLADPVAIDSAVDALDGPVDALFNCAGLSGGAAAPMRVIAVNFLGLRRLTEALVARMKNGSAVASIASLGGLGWEANLAAVREFVEHEDWDDAVAWIEKHAEDVAAGGYAISKQAVIVYTKLRAVPWAARGIRVNVIGPSPVDTPMLADSSKTVGAAYLERFPRPLGRNSTAEEQANVLLFLNSDASSYVTGQLLWTDGGYTAGVLTGHIDPVVGRR